jgi:hypothetical protein
MEREFDEAIVIDAYLAELARLGVHGAKRRNRDEGGSPTQPAALQ